MTSPTTELGAEAEAVSTNGHAQGQDERRVNLLVLCLHGSEVRLTPINE